MVFCCYGVEILGMVPRREHARSKLSVVRLAGAEERPWQIRCRMSKKVSGSTKWFRERSPTKLHWQPQVLLSDDMMMHRQIRLQSAEGVGETHLRRSLLTS